MKTRINCRQAYIPLLASPQGGVAASSKKFRAATEADADGVVFFSDSVGKPPRPLLRLRAVALALRGNQRMLRVIFLIALPPLLAVMQGGEWVGDAAAQDKPLLAEQVFKN